MNAATTQLKRHRWLIAAAVLGLGVVAVVAPRFAQTQGDSAVINQPPVITVLFDTSASSQWTEKGFMAYPEMDDPGDATDPDHHLSTWEHGKQLNLPGSAQRNEDGQWENIGTDPAVDEAIQSVGPCMVWNPMEGHHPGDQTQKEVIGEGVAKGQRKENCEAYQRPHMCETEDGCADRGYEPQDMGYWGRYSAGMNERLDAMVDDTEYRLDEDAQTPRHIQIKQILTGDMRLNYDPVTGQGDGPGCWFVPRGRGAMVEEQICCDDVDPDTGECTGTDAEAFGRYVDYNEVVPHYQEVWDEQVDNGLLDAFGTTALFSVAAFDGYREDGTQTDGWQFPIREVMGGDPPTPYSPGDVPHAGCQAGDDDCHNMGMFRYIGPYTYDIDRVETSRYTRYVQQAILDAGFLWYHEDKEDSDDRLLGDYFEDDPDDLDVYDYPMSQQPVAEASPFGAVFHDLHQFYMEGQHEGAYLSPGEQPDPIDPNHPDNDDYFACRARHSVLFTDGTGIGPEAPNGVGNQLGYAGIMDNEAYGYDEEIFPYLPAEDAIAEMVDEVRSEMESEMTDGDVDPRHYPRVHIMAAGIEGDRADGYGICTEDPDCGPCCSAGQPCGDTCISEDDTCHTAPGDACWAEPSQARKDVVEKLAEMAHAGETCAQYYLPPELLPGSDHAEGPIFNGDGQEGTCGDDDDDDVCLLPQDDVPMQIYDAPQSDGETESFDCEHPALILDREDRETMEEAFRAIFNEIAGMSGVQSPTQPSITNHVDRPGSSEEAGQYRIYSGYEQAGDNPHWKGLLMREFIACDDQTGTIDTSAGEATPLHEQLADLRGADGADPADDEDADSDQRRIFTSMPVFAGADGAEAGPTLRYQVYGDNFAGDVFGQTELDSDESDHRVAMHRTWLSELLTNDAGFDGDDDVYNYFNVDGSDRDEAMDEMVDHLRGRTWQRSDRVLGAIRYSNPQTVGPPNLDLPIDSYREFRRAQAHRPTMTYMTTLDGQLRAIHTGERQVVAHDGIGDPQNAVIDGDDSNIGPAEEQREAWAYVPHMLHQRFAQYSAETNPDMLMDGSPVVEDVRLCPQFGQEGSSTDTFPDERVCPSDARQEWRTVLVQGMDLAGSGYFALDVTRPGADDQGNAEMPDPAVMWEFSDDWEAIQIGEYKGQGESWRYAPNSNYSDERDCDADDIEDVLTGLFNGGDSRLCEFLPEGADSPGCEGLEDSIDDMWDLAFLGSTVGEAEVGMVSKETGDGMNANPIQRPVAVFGAGSSERSEATLPYSDYEISQTCSEEIAGRAIYVVDLQSGRLIRRFVDFNHPDEGMKPFNTDITGTPVLSGADPGDLSTRGFIGDADGRMFRIDLSDPDPREWDVEMFFDPVDEMTDAMGESLDPGDVGPAAFRPALTTMQGRDLVVMYGLGQTDDTASTDSIQAMIGIREEFTGDEYESEKLWIEEFKDPEHDDRGERLTGPPVVFNNDVYFTTFIEPEDACLPGYSRIYRMHYETGEGAWHTNHDQFKELHVDDDGSEFSKWIEPLTPTLIRGMDITMGPSCEAAAADGLGSAGGSQQPQLVAQTGGADLAASDDGERDVGTHQAGASQVGGIGQLSVDLDVPETQAIPLSWSVLEH